MNDLDAGAAAIPFLAEHGMCCFVLIQSWHQCWRYIMELCQFDLSMLCRTYKLTDFFLEKNTVVTADKLKRTGSHHDWFLTQQQQYTTTYPKRTSVVATWTDGPYNSIILWFLKVGTIWFAQINSTCSHGSAWLISLIDRQKAISQVVSRPNTGYSGSDRLSMWSRPI